VTTGAARWFAKKAARRLFGLVPPGRPSGAEARALTYHRFARRKRDPFALSPDMFDAQMEWLALSGRAIDLAQLRRLLTGDTDGLPDRPVLVTIDDGAASTIEVAAPILRRHAIPAVAFITAGRLGKTVHGEPERFLDRDEVRSLATYGLTVGSHAFDHVSLAGLPAAAARYQLAASRELLEDLLGLAVDALAYPFGTARDVSSATPGLARECGYRACFTSRHGAVAAGLDAMCLPRIKIEGGDAVSLFRAAVEGSLDRWRFVDRRFASFQATPG
jgi:peptidoglycan/xylan/chitin deacetylase (PgdA/CDA1 family)